MAKSSIFKFLFEALILPSKNPKLFTHLFLISAISRAFLYLFYFLLINPITSEMIEISKKFSTMDPTNPEFTNLVNTLKKNVKELLILQIVNFSFLFVISFIIPILTYYSFSSIYLGEMLTLKEVFKKVKTNIKGPLITQSITTLFNIVYFVSFAAIDIFLVMYFSTSYTTIYTVLSIFLTTFVILYFSIIWSMSLAISVIETDKYGLAAISHAMKLLKGRKMQIFVLILISFVLSSVIYGFDHIILMFVPSSMISTISLGIIVVIFGEVLVLYNISAVTVLYYECNQTYEEEARAKALYSELSTHDIV